MFTSIGMNEVRNIVINEVDLTRVEDGIYHGKFHKRRWVYDLQVTIKDHKIVEIKNVNNQTEAYNKFIRDAARKIVESQSLQIDIVTGATINTKAFCKAVENALTAQ